LSQDLTQNEIETKDVENDNTVNETIGEVFEGVCNYTGKIVDNNNSPVKGVILVLCEGQNCHFAQSEQSGAFKFEEIPPKDAVLKIVGSVVGFASMSIPVTACKAENETFDDIMLFPLGTPGKVTDADGNILSEQGNVPADMGGTVQAHKDLTITLPPNIEFPNFETEAKVIATELPVDKLPEVLVSGFEFARVFTFEPYSTKLSAPSSLEISFDSQKNKKAVLYAVNYDTGKFEKLFEGTINEQGVFSVAGKGPDELTMIGVIIPE